MALVNQVDKRVKMSQWEIVKFQLLTHCYLYKITVSENDLDCLTLLAIEGEAELTSFCSKAFDLNIFSSIQTVRNCLTKVAKKNLIKKEGKNKKKIYLNPELKVHSQGNILLDFKFLSIETPKG
jgi:uncharacterized ubiquitin-like protein YukD